MRLVLALSFALSTAACATSGTTTQRPTNVAAVRTEINGAIQASTADRSVTAMGKTSYERAVVYTTASTGERKEETWVKANGAWTLESATPIASR